MEIQTIQKYIHTSPRKLRLVADMVRKMEPGKALDILRVTQKDAAKDFVKALETVLANVRQAGIDQDKIKFRKIEINESMVLRRFHAGTRGRVKPFKRRMSHIKIVLSDELGVQTEKQNSRKKEVVDNSAVETKSTEKEKSELSK